MPSTHLPSDHYAANWESEKELKTPEQITELGIEFFSKPEGAEREALLLQLLQAFHGYTTKYLHMILRGHLPYYAGTINEDARIFLQRFLPKGTEANRTTLLHACRSLHLAFKGAEAGEVYDILVMCLLKAINKWNPYYTDGVRKVVDVIDTCFPSRKQFTAYQLNTALNGALGFDGTSVVRMLARRGFLEKVSDPKSGKPVAFRRSKQWPPPPEWFQQGPVGLPYFVSSWFRYYLQQYITVQMKQVESSEDVMQLDHRRAMNASYDNNYLTPRSNELNMPSAEGQMTDANGGTWLCDVDLLKKTLDLGEINLKWVESTNDPLFSSLTRQERYLLYLVFFRELSWKDAAASLGVQVKHAKELYSEMLERLSAAATASTGEAK